MRVSLMQMNQGSDKAANLATARRLIEGAVAEDRPRLVTLPETWTNLGGGRDSRTAAAELLPAPGSGAKGGEDPATALQAVVEAIRVIVAKIEPKLPTAALGV